MATSNSTPASDDSDATTRTTQSSGGGVTANVSLPSAAQLADPKRLLWYGALVAVGALGVLEWPVVAAVGVGTFVSEQFAKSDMNHEHASSSSEPSSTQ